MTRLVFAGGGTGGHIYPALAIAEGVQRRWSETDIHFIGGRRGMESRIVPEAGYPFFGIEAEGWQGRKASKLAHALYTDAKGSEEARVLLRAWRPDAVVGTGGFVFLPVGIAAIREGIPIYIHEQNAMPGLANRLLALWAKRIMVNFEEAVGRFPPLCKKKAVTTGMPVRESIAGADKEEACAFFRLSGVKKTILVTGGSQGAARINQAMLHVIPRLFQKPDTQVLFAAGQRDYPRMAQALREAGIPWEIEDGEASNIRMLPYIDRMDLAYAIAHIYVGRAGASFLAEVTLNRLPSILVPLPNAAENHQAYNAATLAERGGAMVIADKVLTGETLFGALSTLLDDDGRREAMAEQGFPAAQRQALDAILDVLAAEMRYKAEN